MRTTSGAVHRPSDTYRALAIWFTSWSMATNMKSAYMISTIGRYPVIAAPNAIPSMAVSEIAVSKTRASPNASHSPFVAPNGPPGLATSSPKMSVLSCVSIAHRIAAWTAWM